jgi:hypothetical protein
MASTNASVAEYERAIRTYRQIIIDTSREREER